MAQRSIYALPVFKLLMLSPLVITICTAVTDKNNKSLDNSVSFFIPFANTKQKVNFVQANSSVSFYSSLQKYILYKLFQ